MSEHFLHATVTKSADHGSGSWTAVASAPTLDRDGEIIDAGSLTWKGDTIPVHDRHGGSLIGSAHPYYRGTDLLVDGTFSSLPVAQDVRTLVREGHLDRMSVVFFDAAKRIDKAGVPHITSGELLAVDFAPISSNREARVLAARGFGPGRRCQVTKEARKLAMEVCLYLAEVDLAEARRLDAKNSDWRKHLAEAEDTLLRLELDDLLALVERTTGRKL